MQNLSNIPYDAWVDFTFSHEVRGISEAWHFEEEWNYTCSAKKLITNLTELFLNPTPLISKYSLEQIEQGFWFIPGPNGFMWSILSSEVPFDERRKCVESTATLFEKLFCQHENLSMSCYMWWDSVFSYCVLDGKDLSNENEVREQVALTLQKILQTGCRAAKESANHGLDHLKRGF